MAGKNCQRIVIFSRCGLIAWVLTLMLLYSMPGGAATGYIMETGNTVATGSNLATGIYSGGSEPFPFENSRYTIVGDVELHFRFWLPEADRYRGSVLLLHGFSGSTFSWEAAAERMQEMGFEVVAIDIPPFGFSDKSQRMNQGITARAMLLSDFLQQTFPGRSWHLAGHSMGGGIAQAFSLMYPDKLQSVTFVAGALFSRVEEGSTRGGGVLSTWPVRHIAGRLAQSFFITPRRVENLLESAYGFPPRREQVQAYLQPLKIPGTAAAILAGARTSEELVPLQASDMTVPSLAVWGSADRWVPFESRKHVLELMPGIHVELMEDVGHNPMETHLEAFMEIWTRFIDSMGEH